MKLNNTFSVDLEKLIDSKLLVQANSGGGKSWLLRRILEQSHGKVQQIILDPEGEFGTLREKYDYILVGKGGDTPAEPKSAAMLAHKLLELKVSAIIDLYELHPQERKRFVRLFLEAMVNAPKTLWHPVMVVIDEAHTFVPEKGESEASNAVIGLCSLGRKRGFGAILATQRISKLHKDAAAECNNKLIGRTGLDIDRKRAGEELGFTSKDEFLSLRSLKPGEFYGFGPAISDDVTKITVGEIKTSHPKAGARTLTETVPPTEKIKKILSQLADLPAEAEKEARTTAELKAENSKLKNLLVAKNGTFIEKQVNDSKAIEKALDPHLLAFRSVEQGYKNNIERWSEYFDNVLHNVNDFTVAMRELDKMRPSKDPGVSYKPMKTTYTPTIGEKKHIEVIKDKSEGAQLSKGEKIILIAIAQFEEGISNEHLAVLTGYKQTSRRTYIQRLAQKGYIDSVGGNFITTNEGALALGDDYRLLPTGQALREYWMQNLPEGEKKVLSVILGEYPHGVSGEYIETETGYKPTSRRTYLQRLSARKLIETQDGLSKASDKLF